MSPVAATVAVDPQHVDSGGARRRRRRRRCRRRAAPRRPAAGELERRVEDRRVGLAGAGRGRGDDAVEQRRRGRSARAPRAASSPSWRRRRRAARARRSSASAGAASSKASNWIAAIIASTPISRPSPVERISAQRRRSVGERGGIGRLLGVGAVEGASPPRTPARTRSGSMPATTAGIDPLPGRPAATQSSRGRRSGRRGWADGRCTRRILPTARRLRPGARADTLGSMTLRARAARPAAGSRSPPPSPSPLLSIPLAAPGPELVPGAAAEAPALAARPLRRRLRPLAGRLPRPPLRSRSAPGLLTVADAGRLGPPGRRRPGRAALIALFTLAPPLLSLDVFSYISYARLGVEEGLNPYEYAPSAIPGDEAATRVEDFRDAVSVYGPAVHAGLLPAGSAGSRRLALWSLKALAALSVAAIALLTARLARAPRRRAARRGGVRRAQPARPRARGRRRPQRRADGAAGDAGDRRRCSARARSRRAPGSSPRSRSRPRAPSTRRSPSSAPPSRAPAARRRSSAPALAIGADRAAALRRAAPLEALGVAGNNQSTVSRWSVPATLSPDHRDRRRGAPPAARRRLRGIASLGLLAWAAARRRLGARGGLGGLRPARRHRLDGPLVPDLAAAAGGVSRDRALLAAHGRLTLFQAINAMPV